MSINEPENKSNNPPDVVLNLTSKEAAYIFKSVDGAMGICLQMLQRVPPNEKEFATEIVNVLENAKSIRQKLIDEGITNDKDS